MNKSPGIDKIPTIIYKNAAPILAAPLAHMINVSILSRKFPACWKHIIIVPFPKTNPSSRYELRPISLMTVPSKICERLVLNTGLHDRFNDAFGPMQFGCRKLSSTTAALVCLHDFITSALDSNECQGVALLAYDFSKAFDRLGQDIITDALESNNFPPGFILWMSSYMY